MISSQPQDSSTVPSTACRGWKEGAQDCGKVWVKVAFKGHLAQGPWHEQGHLAVMRLLRILCLLRITHSLRSHLCERTRTPLTQTTVPAVSQIPLPAQDCSEELRAQFCLVLSFFKKLTILVCSLFLEKSKQNRRRGPIPGSTLAPPPLNSCCPRLSITHINALGTGFILSRGVHHSWP